MAEFDILPIFTDAYLADTRHLTAAQHGAYFLLLMMAWRSKTNSLPDDDEKLAAWAAMDRRSWAKSKPIVMAFWKKVNGEWRQERLDDERKRADDFDVGAPIRKTINGNAKIDAVPDAKTARATIAPPSSKATMMADELLRMSSFSLAPERTV